MNPVHPVEKTLLGESLALRVKSALEAQRYSFGNEADMHSAIATTLAAAGIPFLREHRLDRYSRLDFFLPIDSTTMGLALEIKFFCPLGKLLRQMKRYAGHPSVAGVVAITVRQQAMPDTLEEKPVFHIALWKKLL